MGFPWFRKKASTNVADHPTEFASMTAVIWIPSTDQASYVQLKNAVYEWRQCWTEQIQQSFTTTITDAEGRPRGRDKRSRLKVAVVMASQKALAHLPAGAKSRRIDELAPVWGLAANVTNAVYSLRGVEIQGSKHFGPGAEVYPHKPYSGDGYERAYVTGLQRDSNKFISILFPTKRLENWRAILIENPIVIFQMRDFNGGWTGLLGDKDNVLELADIMNERVNSQ